MTELVPASEIEGLVGTTRNAKHHIARADSTEQEVYILHSQECLDSDIDLRLCLYSIALDHGIDLEDWQGYEDRPVYVKVDLLLKPDRELTTPSSLHAQEDPR
jgi:hypothetical protein